ncbi:MAG: hypothetical protein Q4Q23_07105, partial [Methanobacteriaceae archaeon]|nr:hypothetical protein [Methanobacteriaceae archaeon]
MLNNKMKLILLLGVILITIGTTTATVTNTTSDTTTNTIDTLNTTTPNTIELKTQNDNKEIITEPNKNINTQNNEKTNTITKKTSQTEHTYHVTPNGEKNTNLNYAIKDINSNGIDGDIYTIKLAEGRYSFDKSINTTLILNKTLTTGITLNLIGTNPENTILDGTDTTKILVITSKFNIIINNLTFVQARSSNNSEGGAITITNGSIIINNSNFYNNNANCGGAIQASHTKLTLIQNSNFINNIANTGGAIDTSYTNSTIIQNSNFINNIANEQGGSITYTYNKENLINNSNFYNNNANCGGAIWCQSKKINILNSVFNNNTVSLNGSAIYNTNIDLITIQNSSFINNKAKDSGSIFNYDQTLTNITNSNFINNTAKNGAILYNQEHNKFIITNSTIIHNTATTGGVIYNNGTLEVTNSCFVDNYNNNNSSKTIFNIADCKLNSNWWGNNTPDWNKLLNNLTNIPNNFIIMNFTLINEGTYKVSLNTLNDSTKLKDTIPFRKLIIQGLNYEYLNESFNNEIIIHNTSLNKYSLKATIDNQTMTLFNNPINVTTWKDLVEIATGGMDVSLKNDITTDNTPLTILNQYSVLIKGNGHTITINNSITSTLITTQGTLILDNITFDGQYTERSDAIIKNNKQANTTITNTIIKNNNNENNGGAIFNNGYLIIMNSSFINNKAITGGGAIYNTNLGNLITLNSSFINCTATTGGAINNKNNLIIINSSFTSNTAGYNGIIFNGNNKELTIINSNFTNNNAVYGGVIYNEGNLNITYSNFINNTAGYGGAIETKNSTYISNSTFINNTATSNGGAIRNNDNKLNILNSSFINNQANSAGGAIYNTGKLNITYSVFVNNNATEGSAIYTTTEINNTNNWWGSNTPNWNELLNDEKYAPTNFVILKLIAKLQSKVYIISLNTLNNNTKIAGLPFRELIIKNEKEVIYSTDKFTGEKTINYNGSSYLTVTLDGQIITSDPVNITTWDELVENVNNNNSVRLKNNITITSSLTIKGNQEILIDGNGYAINREYTIITDDYSIKLSGNLTLNNITFNGGSKKISVSCIQGMDSCNLTIKNSNFINHNGSSVIHGIHETIVTNSNFINNSYYFGGVITRSYKLTIINSNFTNNTSNMHGGVIYNMYTKNSIMNIINSTFIENKATKKGGAIYAEGCIVNITNSIFKDNN